MTARERVAREWHDGSDHAATEPFGGPLCNCDQVAERIAPMLRDVWQDGYSLGDDWGLTPDGGVPYLDNPYLPEEDRHVDQ